jgi:hypothetical protein
MGSYIVITDTIQQAVADAYRMDHLAPGAALLPGPLRAGNAYLRHLTGLGWSTTKAGRRTWGKLPGAGRADYFDCRAYATAVAVHLLTKPPPAADQPIDIPLLHLGGLRF